MADDEPSMVLGRAKRSTAGNRMRALLKSGIEPEELFEEVADDNDFEAAHAEPDIIDSDFDKSSDEEIPEDEAENELEALEKAQRKAERNKKLPTALRIAKAHKSNIGPGEIAPTRKRRVKIKPSSGAVADESFPADESRDSPAEPVRSSNRKSTLARTREVANKLREKQERAAKRVKREHHSKRPKLTQDALIAEALEVEDMNRESLRAYLEQEEERKARARAPKRTIIEGPFVRWRSIAIQDPSQSGAGGSSSTLPQRAIIEVLDAAPSASSSTRAITEAEARVTSDPAVAARVEALRARAVDAQAMAGARGVAVADTQYSRSLVSLHELDEDAQWFERQAALLGNHCEWDLHPIVVPRNRPAHPRQSICPITGLPALYRDGRTGVPFASAEAQHIITDLLDNEYVWTGSLGEAMVNVGCWLSREDEEGAAGIITQARQLLQ
ncbi:hypothetical protein OC844_001345 [Tilletia horrida]|nr:hypothetical protein OC844_001345 [Tilletia horrida]